MWFYLIPSLVSTGVRRITVVLVSSTMETWYIDVCCKYNNASLIKHVYFAWYSIENNTIENSTAWLHSAGSAASLYIALLLRDHGSARRLCLWWTEFVSPLYSLLLLYIWLVVSDCPARAVAYSFTVLWTDFDVPLYSWYHCIVYGCIVFRGRWLMAI